MIKLPKAKRAATKHIGSKDTGTKNTVTKLTATQSLILTAGAQRAGNLALPLSNGLAGAAAKMAVTRMIDHGWLQEVDANPRQGEPLWRETGDGHGTTLVVTDAGLLAIGIASVVAKAVACTLMAKPEPAPMLRAAAGPEVPMLANRTDTKQAQIIMMLQRPEGGTIAEIVAMTGWQSHTVRAAISGALKKKLGLSITTGKVEGRGTVYLIS